MHAPHAPSSTMLRRWSREQVANLDAARIAQAPRLVLAHLEGWMPWRTAQDVALFASLPGELSTAPLLDALWKRGTRTWLPWIGDEGTMEMALVRGPADLVPGRYGILEPARARENGDHIPSESLVLTPGTVFDRYGGRIGKGKGYYDRWFAAHPQTLAVGLCFEAQVHPEPLPLGPHDWPMAHLITECGVRSFSASPLAHSTKLS